jgi:hypothetical protein
MVGGIYMSYPQVTVFIDDLEGTNAFLKEKEADSPVVISANKIVVPARNGASIAQLVVVVQHLAKSEAEDLVEAIEFKPEIKGGLTPNIELKIQAALEDAAKAVAASTTANTEATKVVEKPKA